MGAGQGGPHPAVRGVETVLAIDGVAVRLWQAAELERFVDAAALLRADAPPEPPYWMHLWPGAVAAARCIARADAVRPGARVLELGCGLGLPAIVAARRGAAVVASDREHAALAFVRRSAALNDCRVAVAQMDWDAPPFRAPFDVCIGADVAYDAAAEPGLAAALGALVRRPGMAWLADSVNTARDSLAERLRQHGFAIAVRQVRESEEGRTVWVRVLEARRA